jgi:hypothetical protein
VEACSSDAYAHNPCEYAQHDVPVHAIEVFVVLTLPFEHVIRGRHPPICALFQVAIVNRWPSEPRLWQLSSSSGADWRHAEVSDRVKGSLGFSLLRVRDPMLSALLHSGHSHKRGLGIAIRAYGGGAVGLERRTCYGMP